MTSWIRVPSRKGRDEAAGPRPFSFQPDDSDICTQLNSYCYAAIAAKRQGLPLLIQDTGSFLGAVTPFLQGLLEPAPPVQFPEVVNPRAISLARRQIARVLQFLAKVSQEEILQEAKTFLQFNSATVARNSAIRAAAGLPAQLDLGIHIRAGAAPNSRPLPLSSYVDAIRDFKRIQKVESPAVFVVCDRAETVAAFQKVVAAAADLSGCTVHSMPFEGAANFISYAPEDLKRLSGRARLAALQHFVAELAVLQSIPNFICTMSSQVGRFIYLTHPGLKTFRSLDMQVFSIA